MTTTCLTDPECAQSRSRPGHSAPSDGRGLPKWLIQNRRGGWRRIAQNFAPSWFAVTMGTGIVSILLHSFSTIYPGYQSSLNTLSIIFFALNVFLFLLIFGISILRYILYPATWSLMLQHPVQSLFLGTIPMGFATIVNMFTLVYLPRWGGATSQIALACCFGLPYQMMTKHKTRHDTMTAAWPLPIVAPIVASASGALVANALPDPQNALITITTSYILWGTGVPLAFVVLVIYFHRLVVYKLPPNEVIVSVFLPLGPMGQGGYAIMQLGSMAVKFFPETGTLHTSVGDVLYVLGFGVAIVMWGFGLVWLFFTLGAVLRRGRFPFNMGWWGFTFPISVYAMGALKLGEEMPSAFFKIFGTVFGVSVLLLWFIDTAGTVQNMLRGRLFEAP
ncbi:C4-dicarboxylate transporter/malic acid transport protein-like protein [Bimuria novae-zelandiae CBS 107.79]|uniref:Sulfite efflux pump SSU1 n=1 Tax=Bimuria novae-zelandiae CBS 107.79 TaxID=1447943 RepID=A0A6A5V0V3_9PLEO|nr:C4-dicarboxylate transporter/malic acid transport protein-like protein [Bimuria novae-zelandiae CBS 107.79]